MTSRYEHVAQSAWPRWHHEYADARQPNLAAKRGKASTQADQPPPDNNPNQS